MGRSDALNNLGNVAQEQADVVQAYRYHEESLALRRELADSWGVAVSLSNLGNVAYVQGDYATARSYFDESLEVAQRREVDDRLQRTYPLVGLGNVAFEQGDYPEASSRYERALTIRHELDFKWGMADVLNRLGKVALEQRDLAAAGTFFQESLTIKLKSGDRWGIAESLAGAAAISALAQRPHDALCLAGAAAAIQESVGVFLQRTDQERLARYLEPAQHQLADNAARALLCGDHPDQFIY